MGQVSHHHGLANAFGSKEDGASTLVHESKRKEVFEGFPVDVFGPRPIEVGQCNVSVITVTSTVISVSPRGHGNV